MLLDQPWLTRLPLCGCPSNHWHPPRAKRSEEHTSELQSQSNLVCRPSSTLFPYTTLFRSWTNMVSARQCDAKRTFEYRLLRHGRHRGFSNSHHHHRTACCWTNRG